MAEFIVARNPDPTSALPYLIRLPLEPRAVVLKARETWSRTSKVYCHPADAWPDDPDIVERTPVKVCVRRGPAVELVLDRGREHRSQLVFTRLKDGREAVFWQSAKTTKAARPGVRMPTAHAAGLRALGRLEVLVDTRERYGYRFSGHPVDLVRAPLPAGDYGIRVNGELCAAVERKSLADFAGSLVDGRLGHQLAELAALDRAAVVVEDRYSRLLRLPHLRASFAADLLARVQVRWPEVPVFFAETRPLAELWTYRFLAAAVAEDLAATGLAARVADRGRIPAEVTAAFRAAQEQSGQG